MAVDTPGEELLYVIRQFPTNKMGIHALYTSSDDFRSLCSDYCLCVSTLGQLAEGNESSESIREYTLLKRSLEREIMFCLDEYKDMPMRLYRLQRRKPGTT